MLSRRCELISKRRVNLQKKVELLLWAKEFALKEENMEMDELLLLNNFGSFKKSEDPSSGGKTSHDKKKSYYKIPYINKYNRWRIQTAADLPLPQGSEYLEVFVQITLSFQFYFCKSLVTSDPFFPV